MVRLAEESVAPKVTEAAGTIASAPPFSTKLWQPAMPPMAGIGLHTRSAVAEHAFDSYISAGHAVVVHVKHADAPSVGINWPLGHARHACEPGLAALCLPSASMYVPTGQSAQYEMPSWIRLPLPYLPTLHLVHSALTQAVPLRYWPRAHDRQVPSDDGECPYLYRAGAQQDVVSHSSRLNVAVNVPTAHAQHEVPHLCVPGQHVVQTRGCVSWGHALPPNFGAASTRLRCCVPEPQLTVQAPQDAHAPTTQSTGQAASLQARVSAECGHAAPPSPGCVDVRVRVCAPAPQLVVHVE